VTPSVKNINKTEEVTVPADSISPESNIKITADKLNRDLINCLNAKFPAEI